MTGRFITFEGPDGAGKTTQMKMLGERLKALGKKVVYTREPGGTKISEEVRKLLLDPSNKEMVHRTEALLYAAARAQHVEELIRPALTEGNIVLCDRFTDSTLAYQGFGRGINLSMLEELNNLAISGVVPNITLILDLDSEVGIERISSTRVLASGVEKDRIELENIDFHLRVREGFRRLAAKEPGRCKIVDAKKDIDTVHNEIYRLVKEVLINEDSSDF